MEDIAEEEDSESRIRCCPTALTNVIFRIFDFSLLASVTFVVLGIAGFLSLMALFVPFMFLPGNVSLGVFYCWFLFVFWEECRIIGFNFEMQDIVSLS